MVTFTTQKLFFFSLLQVNKNFAIDLIAEQPVSEVESRIISCDGGGGALGHPKVYINLVILLFFIQRVLLVNSYLEDYLSAC